MHDKMNNKSNNYNFNIKKYLIFSLCVLFLFIINSFINKSNTIIYNGKNNEEVIVSVMLGSVIADDFPSILDGYSYDKTICSNGTIATWDNSNWKLNLEINGSDKCVVYFSESVGYVDFALNGADPVMNAGLIPVNITDAGVVTVADTSGAWYNYAEKKWANAVIVDDAVSDFTPGVELPMDNIEQMYVWIPRFSYDSSSFTSDSEAIDITFGDTSMEAHPSFTFGTEELSGIWVGKFETGFNPGESADTVDVELVIKPNVNSISKFTLSQMFYKIQEINNNYGLDSSSDVHMMKNTDWAAVSILTQSIYGICTSDIECYEIENNNYYNSVNDISTGCGGEYRPVVVDLYGEDICPVENRWNSTLGYNASTTKNITGIYDMSAGRYEYVMANVVDADGNQIISSSGFVTLPDAKYYDSYPTNTDSKDHSNGIYGDSMAELNIPYGNYTWNNDIVHSANITSPWLARGGRGGSWQYAGMWGYYQSTGNSVNYISSRNVLTH